MNKLQYLLTIFACVLLTACGDDPATTDLPEEGSGEAREIRFSGLAPAAVTVSKAAAGFPNDGRAGIVAGYYDPSPTYWTIYSDINNVPVTATSVADSVYTLKWDQGQEKYWPFDNSGLLFLAYTPYSEESPAVEMNYNRTSLTLTLQDDMPEVMYASNNASYIPYNRDSLVVNLGQFRHALSQLTVKVVADPTANPSLLLKDLSIHTRKKTAILELLEGDQGIYLGANEDFTYQVETTPVDFGQNEASYTVMLFPGSEPFTTISLTIQDGILSFPYEFAFSDFSNTDDSSVPLALQRGRNTVLTITIKGTQVEQPDDSHHLTGIVSDWKYQGSLGVTIE